MPTAKNDYAKHFTQATLNKRRIKALRVQPLISLNMTCATVCEHLDGGVG
jgi:hypothetical protein